MSELDDRELERLKKLVPYKVLAPTPDEICDEIERLNNIINELEKGIENMWVDNSGDDIWQYEEEMCLYREEFLDKIKELKGSDK